MYGSSGSGMGSIHAPNSRVRSRVGAGKGSGRGVVKGIWVQMYDVIKTTVNTICIISDCMCDGVVNVTIKMSPYTSGQVDPGRTGTRAGRSERLCETRCST